MSWINSQGKKNYSGRNSTLWTCEDNKGIYAKRRVASGQTYVTSQLGAVARLAARLINRDYQHEHARLTEKHAISTERRCNTRFEWLWW